MSAAPEATIDVVCPAGELTGLDRGSTLVFKGIRFARAGRFAEPEVVESWADRRDGPYDATSFGPRCPQGAGALDVMLGGSGVPTDEDCLHLNVYTPGCDDRRRPVLFWVHGGAYVTGGAAMPWYDGSRLATRGDVVVVTINYRLGALGFLGDRNLGILDQVAALRWVARNVAAFGGDPGNVTIFGESAGGSSVIALAAAPGAAGLHHRTFAMSPSILQFRTPEEAAANERTFLDRAGADTIEQLRSAPLERLMAAQAETIANQTRRARSFSPTESTPSIPGPIVEVAAGDARPLVIGTTRDEARLFGAFDPRRHAWTAADVERQFARVFGEATPRALDAYRRARPGAGPNALVCAMETDEMFRVEARALADHRADNGHATWSYLFDYETPVFGGVLGSCHALDIPFAFDNLHRPGVDLFTGVGAGRQAIADQFAGALLAFARSGEPGWTRYETGTRPTQRIGPQPVVACDPDADLRRLWETSAR